MTHKSELLQLQLEIQEQTFQNISQEIHDNIGQKLTLAKLQLNTLDFASSTSLKSQVGDSVKIIGDVINDLSDLSRSMSSEIILNNGFVKALEFEVNQMNKPGMYAIKLRITGEPVFMDANKELILFRIVQEALNNIVKHAEATDILIDLHFTNQQIELTVCDNGVGFSRDIAEPGNGLSNMRKRAAMLNGICHILSEPGKGTSIQIQIPLYDYKPV